MPKPIEPNSDVITPAPNGTPGFAARLREATKDVHREAERTGFIAEMIRGRADRNGYRLFLQNLEPVYAALETVLGTKSDSAVLSAFAEPGLRRLPRLRGDLDAMEQAFGPMDMSILPEASAYGRMIASAQTDEACLVAHAYARYLGDLSGGQILKPILARSLDLEPAMLRFYDFPEIADPEAAKAMMREALDVIPAADPMADRIIGEAVAAFRANIDLSLAVARKLDVLAA